jgi:hypothetical protein
MKRLCAVLSLVLLLIVLALPAMARADDPTAPDGWTWDGSSVPSMTPDGWTWDEL